MFFIPLEFSVQNILVANFEAITKIQFSKNVAISQDRMQRCHLQKNLQ